MVYKRERPFLFCGSQKSDDYHNTLKNQSNKRTNDPPPTNQSRRHGIHHHVAGFFARLLIKVLHHPPKKNTKRPKRTLLEKQKTRNKKRKVAHSDDGSGTTSQQGQQKIENKKDHSRIPYTSVYILNLQSPNSQPRRVRRSSRQTDDRSNPSQSPPPTTTPPTKQRRVRFVSFRFVCSLVAAPSPAGGERRKKGRVHDKPQHSTATVNQRNATDGEKRERWRGGGEWGIVTTSKLYSLVLLCSHDRDRSHPQQQQQ